MEDFEEKRQQNNKNSDLRQFSGTPTFGRMYKDLTDNNLFEKSKEQIINKAIEFHLQGNISQALQYYKYCINKDFNDHNVYSNYGTILKDIGRLKEAELATRKAIQIKPDFAEAYYNLGNIMRDISKFKEAEKLYLKSIDLKTDFADAYYNLSLIELQKGNYQSGLINYEFRFKKKEPIFPHSKTKLKIVSNKKLTKEEKLLVVTEQGLGDTIQFMRYVPFLRNQGFDISFCAQEKLHTLIKASDIDQNPLTPADANIVSNGKWIPLLSLPRYLKISPKKPIVSNPYIHSTDELTNKWKKKFSRENRPIIGINWQGNAKAEKKFQPGRSIPLEIFSILFDCNKITMLSLQKGFGSEQLEHCSFKDKFVGCQSEINSIWDFLENAAIINNCDLIITSDTSVAHLAGGMGKPTWLLLKDLPEWRWGLAGDSTFWYPSMKLFRQKERHNWHEVMKRVSIKLKAEI